MASGYPFSIPLSGVSPGTAAGLDEAARLLGRDILFTGDYEVTPGMDWQTVEGLAALRQWVYLCLITNPGELKAVPEYGAGLKRFVKEAKTPALLAQLKTQIRTALLLNTSIREVVVTVADLSTVVAGGEGLQVGVWVTALGQKVNLGAFAVTDR